MKKRARNDESKENRKLFILKCAEELILEEGLSNLSLAKVSKKSKLAVGTIYLYFASKEDIIAHLTLKSRQILLDKFIEHTAKARTPITKVEAVLKAFYSFYIDHPFYSQLVSFYESNAGLEEPEELLESSRKITMFVVDIVRDGKQKKLIRKDLDEMEFAFMLWGTAIGIIQLIEVKSKILTSTLNATQEHFFSRYTNLIINGIKA